MKVLITGATGKIGISLAESLSKNHELVLLGRTPKMKKSAISYSVDIGANEQLAQIFDKEKPKAVVHLAGSLARDCEEDPDRAYKVNVEATKKLAQLAKYNGVERFIFASSSAVYNQTRLEPTNEQDSIEPKSIYAKTKLQAEEQLQSEARSGQTKFISLRLFNVYGPVFDESLVYKLIHSTKTNPAFLFGPDNFYRDYIHISDVVLGFSKSLTSKVSAYNVFNIATGRVRSNTQLIEELQEMGRKLYFETKKHPTSISWADISKAKQTLDFKPSTELIVNKTGNK